MVPSVICSSTCSCRIHTDAMNNRRAKNSLTKYLPLTLLQGFVKGYLRFACERELEIEHNCNILSSKLMAVNVVSFSFFWCSTGALRSTLLGAGFLYCILSASSLDPNSSGPQAPSAWRGFTYHISSISVPTLLQVHWPSDSTGNWTGTGTQLS